jgi:hypothetical protein
VPTPSPFRKGTSDARHDEAFRRDVTRCGARCSHSRRPPFTKVPTAFIA